MSPAAQWRANIEKRKTAQLPGFRFNPQVDLEKLPERSSRYRQVSFMEVDQVATTTSLDDRRRLKLYLAQIFGSDPCALFSSPHLRNIRVPPVTSASDSIIVICDVDLPEYIAYSDVIFKITFAPNSTHNQYAVESAVYKLVSQFELPFVMQHIHTFLCSTFESSISNPQVRERLRNMQSVKRFKYDFNRAQIIMCERGRGECLAKSLGKVKDAEWTPIYIQILFCLAFFEEMGIMHHDLHLGNVWLDRTDALVTYKLYTDRTLAPIEFTTNVLVKIYDFDHSSMSRTMYNTHVKDLLIERNDMLEREFCNPFGRCNRMQPGRDFAQVCWWLNQVPSLSEAVKGCITESIDQAFLSDSGISEGGRLSFAGDPCIHRANGSPCTTEFRMESAVKLVQKMNRDFVKSHPGRAPSPYGPMYMLPSYGAWA